METWVESFFFSNPPQPHDAPETRHSSGRSRAVDIYMIEHSPSLARISYSESERLATASTFKEATLRPLLESTVNIDIENCSYGKYLTATAEHS